MRVPSLLETLAQRLGGEEKLIGHITALAEAGETARDPERKALHDEAVTALAAIASDEIPAFIVDDKKCRAKEAAAVKALESAYALAAEVNAERAQLSVRSNLIDNRRMRAEATAWENADRGLKALWNEVDDEYKASWGIEATRVNFNPEIVGEKRRGWQELIPEGSTWGDGPEFVRLQGLQQLRDDIRSACLSVVDAAKELPTFRKRLTALGPRPDFVPTAIVLPPDLSTRGFDRDLAEEESEQRRRRDRRETFREGFRV